MEEVNAKPTIRQDVLHVLNVVFPVALGNFVEYFPVCVGMAFVGHNGDAQSTIELDAVALSRAYFCSVAMAPGFGVITALRTLCPQAVGAGQPRLCAVYLQRALLFVLLVSAIIMPLLLKADRVLLALGQPKEIVALTQPYIMRMALSYYGVVGMSAIQRVYQAHSWNYANLLIVSIVFLCAPGLQWLLIHTCKLGYLGNAWAASAYNLSYFVLQIPHLICTGHGYLFVPRRQTFSRSGLCEYLRLMLPGFIMCVVEWWVLEVVVLLSGRLHDAKLTVGAFTISSQVQALALMAWIGLAVAASSLVGQRIGAGDTPAAKQAAYVTVIVGAALAAVLGGATAAAASPISRAFTPSADIERLTSKLLPLIAGVMLLDATSNALGGVCSGLGLQRVAALAQLAGYYLLGVPFALIFAFWLYHSETIGVFFLWGGVALAMLAASAVQLIALCRHDWARSAKEASVRLARGAAADLAAATSSSSTGGVDEVVVLGAAAHATEHSSACSALLNARATPLLQQDALRSGSIVD